MELQFFTIADGVDLSLCGGSPLDKSITHLHIDWRLIIDNDAKGISGMYPIVGKVAFTYAVEEHDFEHMAKDDEKETTIVLESSPDFSDNYEDKAGDRWSVEIDYSNAGKRYLIEDFWVDLDAKKVNIEFSDTTNDD